MAPRKWCVAEEEEKEKLKSELVARVIQSVAWRGAIINSDNSVAELQKIELPKAKKAKKAEKDVELKVVEEEVEEGTKTIVIEFFFRFFCFFVFFFCFWVLCLCLVRKVKQKISVLIWFSYSFRLKG